MGVITEKYIRKPLYVDAVRVTADNIDEIANWCQGEVQTEEVPPGSGTTKKFVRVRVHQPKNPRQTKAFVNDWVLYTERGYKVYMNKPFHAAFDPVDAEPETSAKDANNSDSPFEGMAEEYGNTAGPDAAAPIQAQEPVPEQLSEDAAGEKRVLSKEEQDQLGPDEVRALVRSGAVVLVQDLAESA